ncbi:ABC transporter permease subunit [Flavihumibacter stibioxidans]|uniref:Nitrous oxide reductase n=1 Tax=Flavihumibacter stibioxidans TaxID=1834163 RepID=A0ABR7MBU7_9BACT|nr:ABC transporter permease subunit [Flavihumibacter stibioxidans]MBC6492499.1 nitrous oxide reductase [Flavihumibacter stibioxidans]
MKKIIKYIILDILKNRIVIAYTLLLLVISLSLFMLEDNPAKSILGLMNITLIIVPLISIIFCTIYLYNSNEFIELLVAQPIRRTRLLSGIYLGLVASLLVAALVGIGIPILLYSPTGTGLTLLLTACGLSIVFASLALLAAVLTRDKAKGIGLALLLWFYFSFIYDGLVLMILFQFADYPMDNTMIGLSMLNPIDLGRILLLLQLDISAMMGFTGALFQDFFGSRAGIIFASFVMLAWMILPASYAIRKFRNKDL